MTTAAPSTRPCPKCGAPMPMHRDFIAWCASCDFNLEGDQKDYSAKNRFDQLYEELGRKQSQVIFDQIQQDRQFQARWSRTRILIYLIAALVHFASLLLFAAGVALLVVGWRYFLVDFFALLFLALAWFLRPRPNPQPAENVLASAEHPELHGLVQRIAQSMGTRIDQIVVDETFNAGFSLTGLKQRKTLTLGLPLWSVLNDQERVALLGHEVAHSVNGDAARGFFVGTAIQSLMRWYIVIAPAPLVDPETNHMNILAVPFKLIAAGFAALIWALFRGLSILLFRDMQRAEYLADRLGAGISGVELFVAMMRKLVFFDTYRLAVQHVALDAEKRDLFDELRGLIEQTPESELERRRRLEERCLLQLDVTHPPTLLRMRMLESAGVTRAAIIADPTSMDEIDRRLAPLRKKVQLKVINQYRAAITR